MYSATLCSITWNGISDERHGRDATSRTDPSNFCESDTSLKAAIGGRKHVSRS